MANKNEIPINYGNLSRFYQNLKNNDLNGIATEQYVDDAIAEIPQLEAGENIEIADNKINAKGYFYDDEPKEESKLIDDILHAAGLPAGQSLGLKISGAAGATTYTWADEMNNMFTEIIQYGMLPGVGGTYKTANGKSGVIAAVDATTITFEETLDADNALTNEPVDYIVETKAIHSFIVGNSSPAKFNIANIYGGEISGDAGATTYNYTSGSGSTIVVLLFKPGWILEISNGRSATIKSVDYTNNTITFDKTLDANNAISNEMVLYETVFPIASNEYTYTEGRLSLFGMYLPNIAIGVGAHAEGGATTASGDNSHTEGLSTTASGAASHAEGIRTTASGEYSHAEGTDTTAPGRASHTEGNHTSATGTYSHAEGSSTTASGANSHAEGTGTEASGETSHAEGIYCKAIAKRSHAEGESCQTNGELSHVEGGGNISNNKAEHNEGMFSVSHKASDTYGNAGNTQHTTGIGDNSSARKNAFEIMQNGDMYILGVGGYQGTDTKVQDATIKTLQEYIASLEARIAALEGNTAAS